jgi:hypothetical protein
MNLFEIMRHAGGGNGYGAFGPQFGLSDDQVAKAIQAFLPAFSTGLKRSTADPFGMVEFLQRLGMGQYAPYYLNPGHAAAQGRDDGLNVLALLFGSKEVSNAVAAQASAITGIAQQTLLQMLPAVAATMFGGLQQQAVTANPMLEAMLGHFAGSTPPRRPDEKGPLDRYEDEQEQTARRDATASPFAHVQTEAMQSGLSAMAATGVAWGEMMKTLMAGAAGGPGAQARGEVKPAIGDLFGDMFEPGLRFGEAYQRSIETIFDSARPRSTRS